MPETSPYPAGKTFLDTLKVSFVDVLVNKEKDNAISTTEFLEAAESLTTLFGRWNSTCCYSQMSCLGGEYKNVSRHE
jgi:hypothetical protein